MSAIIIALLIFIIVIIVFFIYLFITRKQQISQPPVHTNTPRVLQNSVSSDFPKIFANNFALKTTVPKNVTQSIFDLVLSVYPKMVNDFPSFDVDDLAIVIDDNADTSHTDIAYTNGKKIIINGKNLAKHPTKINFVVHELFHALQNITHDEPPKWIVEGMADWARDNYGSSSINMESGWQLKPPTSKNKYTDSYQVTAAFFKYLNTTHPNILKTLYNTMILYKYNDDFWKNTTNLTIDQLWQQYVDASHK